MKSFQSNGKLLISGEYVVLDGALSLAIPTKYGQSLEIESHNKPEIIWESFDYKNNIWFKGEFHFHEIRTLPLETIKPNNPSQRLLQILIAAKKLNPLFLDGATGFKITTKLDFPQHWGLGTSSTLINNIAQWVNINPYTLLENTFGGSGYDIACAQNNTPITYQVENKTPIVNTVNFDPSFKNNLYFVYLNKKQNSRDGIAHYKANKDQSKSMVSEISTISMKMISSNTLENFDSLIEQHESIISSIIKQKPVKALLFSDFNGQMKSLGAWGGDFILVTSKTNPTSYFNEKGFDTVIAYADMVL
ncbi:MAG: GYDIA family GHMP kinase [Algibacter sp.]